ncbi:MAG: DUF502 domain-containing protein [Proteobacteria bacterium]|jgi:uncharacterized membrane protein|nr:DUF502 domain-containing protein [Pseudomonadota bacterium]MCG6935842.1 DUF502 domain-containing protein [Pseudomonadota bacterium]
MLKNLQRYLFTGALTVVPIWITWVVFEFFFILLSNLGRPGANALSRALRAYSPTLADALLVPWLQSFLAIVLTLLALYLLGWTTTRVIGRRLLNVFDRLMHRIPVVQTIYGSVQKLIGVLQSKPDKIQRVVLIAFPNPDMRTVGFVTKVMNDASTGRELAAVYVPTTPNPTSGYMEIVPLDQLTPTDWSMDEAMTFILSAGAVAPDRIIYDKA